MFGSIEVFLEKVAEHLRPMPLARRDEELREIRAHLEAAIVACRERGLSEEESAQAVLRQFGAPRAAAMRLVAAWGRGVLLRVIRPVGVWALIFAGFYSIPYITGPLIAHLFGGVWQGQQAEIIPRHPLPPLGRAMLMAGAFAAYPLAAWALGFAYPKDGVRATALATAIWLLIVLAINPHRLLWTDGAFLVSAACITAQAPASSLGAWCRRRLLARA